MLLAQFYPSQGGSYSKDIKLAGICKRQDNICDLYLYYLYSVLLFFYLLPLLFFVTFFFAIKKDRLKYDSCLIEAELFKKAEISLTSLCTLT